MYPESSPVCPGMPAMRSTDTFSKRSFAILHRGNCVLSGVCAAEQIPASTLIVEGLDADGKTIHPHRPNVVYHALGQAFRVRLHVHSTSDVRCMESDRAYSRLDSRPAPDDWGCPRLYRRSAMAPSSPSFDLRRICITRSSTYSSMSGEFFATAEVQVNSHSASRKTGYGCRAPYKDRAAWASSRSSSKTASKSARDVAVVQAAAGGSGAGQPRHIPHGMLAHAHNVAPLPLLQ